ncbi:MAG: chemotaxis protein CheX [Deltaproteobacteria bacterium]|nr:chemotaxis protein CheX [Deltaproteobacteria bacterium]
MAFDVRIINSFLAAAVHVIKTMARVDSEPGKPFLKADDRALGDISAVIDISGAEEGSMALSFEESCIKAIVSNLFGEPVTEINTDVKDAVGELTNVICGDARRRIAEKSIVLQAGIPTIVAGNNHRINHPHSGPRLAIPFTTASGRFTVEITFRE